MTQHHRLTPKARNLSVASAASLTDNEIHQICMRARWGSTEKQVCHHCGTEDEHYKRRPQRRASRRPSSGSSSAPQWRCRHCGEIFSITSGTLFHQTQLSLRKIYLAIVLALGNANGKSSVTLSIDIGVTPKTAFLLLHRLREAMAEDGPQGKFSGIAQMDGGYFCGKPRKPNRKMHVTKAQLARRWGKKPIGETEKPWVAMGMTQKNYQKAANKRTVLVVTDSGGPKDSGSKNVAVVVSRGENVSAIQTLAHTYVEPGALIMTDEAGAYKSLQAKWDHESVSHAEEFCSADGVNDNHCEAFFSRLRRAEYGIYHGFRPAYLYWYAWEAAWRHNTRALSKSEQVERLLRKCLTMQPSNRLRGYYQGTAMRIENLI